MICISRSKYFTDMLSLKNVALCWILLTVGALMILTQHALFAQNLSECSSSLDREEFISPDSTFGYDFAAMYDGRPLFEWNALGGPVSLVKIDSNTEMVYCWGYKPFINDSNEVSINTILYSTIKIDKKNCILYKNTINFGTTPDKINQLIEEYHRNKKLYKKTLRLTMTLVI